jgi:hypothetical protein
MAGLHSKTRVSKSTGENAPIKKDGYAKGSVPKSMIGSKEGITNKKGYSGPNVQRGKF